MTKLRIETDKNIIKSFESAILQRDEERVRNLVSEYGYMIDLNSKEGLIKLAQQWEMFDIEKILTEICVATTADLAVSQCNLQNLSYNPELPSAVQLESSDQKPSHTLAAVAKPIDKKTIGLVTVAIIHEEVNKVQLLMQEHKFDPRLEDENGDSPWNKAYQIFNEQIIEILREYIPEEDSTTNLEMSAVYPSLIGDTDIS